MGFARSRHDIEKTCACGEVRCVVHVREVKKVPKLEDLRGQYQYVEGTRTSDTSRFAQHSSLPIELKFTDRMNKQHKVVIEDMSDEFNMCVPVGNSSLYWYGDEKDRTGFDAQTTWASVKFTYASSSFVHSHGITIEFNGYSDNGIGENKINTERWNNIMDNAVKGSEIVSNLASAYSPAE